MPYVGTEKRTLIVNSIDLQALPYLLLTSLDVLRAPGLRKGEDDDVPRRPGLVLAPGLKYSAYAFNLPVHIAGTTAAEFEANFGALLNICLGSAGDGLVPLTRRLDIAASPFYVEHTAHGRFVAQNSFTFLNRATGTTVLQFLNGDGAWWDASAAKWIL
jgi:hypothetical protein